MNALLKRSTMLFIAIGFLAATTFSSIANAHTAMKWCTTWLTDYVDSGFGEDVFPDDVASVYYDAAHTYAMVQILTDNKDPWVDVWEGELDSLGCTPYLAVVGNSTFRLRQATKAQRSNRRIYVNPDSGSWGTTYTWLNSTFTTGTIYFNFHYSHTFTPNWSSPKANIMPIAGRILNQYPLLEYPDNTYTYVRTDSTNCVVNNAHEGGAYYDGSGHVCLRGSGATGWDDATTYKFLVGHVFGHRMADVNGGPLNSGFDNDDAPGPCRCIDFTAYGGNTHCMGSRDPIEAAESEGFADFFSTAVFNNRSESEAKIFSYPQETYFCFLSGGKGYLNIDWDPPHVFPASLDESGSNCNTFMTYVCDPGEADLGVELDWLRLTWELWTTGNEFSMDQISDIWEDTSGGNWDDLLATVESQWEASDPDKVNVFNNKSIQSGVNHYSD